MSVLVPIAVLLLLLIAAAPVVAEMRAGSIAGWPKRKGPMVSTDVWPDHNLPGLCALAPEGEPAVVGGIDRQPSKNWMVGNVRPISRQEFFATYPAAHEPVTLDQLEAAEQWYDRRPIEAIVDKEMVDGYFDGLNANVHELPKGSNRSDAYRHGWPNGHDDRCRSPREMVAALRSKAEDLRRGFVRDE